MEGLKKEQSMKTNKKQSKHKTNELVNGITKIKTNE
jgi:hypothetical protein